jgi:hypothetical protein
MRNIIETFILDEHYRDFLRSKTKSQRLYHSNENGEPSLLLGLTAFICGMLLFLLPFIVMIFGLGSFFSFQTFGVETEAIVTDLNHKRLEYIYDVNGQIFEGVETLGDYSSSGYAIGQSFRVLYLVYAPEQNARPSSVWGSLTFLLLIFPILLLGAAVFFYLGIVELNKSVATYKKFQHFQNAVVLKGEVTSAALTLFDARYGYPILTVHYCFLSPDGKTLRGVRRHKRSDLTKNTLPEEGTPVNILYADDDCYMLLYAAVMSLASKMDFCDSNGTG